MSENRAFARTGSASAGEAMALEQPREISVVSSRALAAGCNGLYGKHADTSKAQARPAALEDRREFCGVSVRPCPIFVVKRTSIGSAGMSALDPKRTWAGSFPAQV